ncbi:MAG: cytochrome c maturation protein CcmE [Coriobacteriales bacterium]
MNSKMKKRMVAVGGVIVIVVILLLAFLGGGNAAKVVSVGDAAGGAYDSKKVQVSGLVVDNSYSVDAAGVLSFDIAAEDDPAQAVTLHVVYDKGVSATFGNGISAICTGRIEGGQLVCTELVTKCPSKYENATEALSVAQLKGYELQTMEGTTVKVAGTVAQLGDVTAAERLVIADAEDAAVTLGVTFNGALPADVAEGANVVLTGALNAGGRFLATEVALQS